MVLSHQFSVLFFHRAIEWLELEGIFKGCLILEGYPVGVSPKEGHQDDYGDEALLQGKAERTGFVQPGKKIAWGGPNCRLPVPEDGEGLCTRAWTDRTRRKGVKPKGLKPRERGFRLDVR